MNQKILLFCIFISIISTYSISVYSAANSEIQELFGDEEEIEEVTEEVVEEETSEVV